MSDYQYEQEYNYEEEAQADEEENVETRVELEYFQIEGLIRNGEWAKAISQLQGLYTISSENNLKTYKIKILNQLLQIYSSNSKIPELKTTLNRIVELNTQQKYTENSIKSIISILRAANYFKIKAQVIAFIERLDSNIRIKSYLYLLEKSLEEADKKESSNLFQSVSQLMNEMEVISASITLQFYSLEIKYSKLNNTDISDRIHDMELKIPTLQVQAYMSQGHISVLKLAIAQTMFKNGNYENSSLYIAESFIQKAKYGNSPQLKQILKTNGLLSLLIQNQKLRKESKYNSLYHESSNPFKNEKDIQSLISLIDAYERHDLQKFEQNYKNLKFNPQSSIYLDIYTLLLFNMKKEKLILILKSYKLIKFGYIGRRLSLNEASIQKMAFELIIDGKIKARIHIEDPKQKYIETLQAKSEFLQIQAQNLKQLAKRYLVTN